MRTIKKSIEIAATAELVWQVMWNSSTNKQWAASFGNGMQFASKWKTGDQITLANDKGYGSIGIIEEIIPNELLRVREKGWIEHWKQLPVEHIALINGKPMKWEAGIGEYRLIKKPHSTLLSLEIEVGAEWFPITDPLFEDALEKIKLIAEGRIILTVATKIQADRTSIWDMFNNPKDIVNWNTALPDWHTPSAENDLRESGSFKYRMEAKDGSFGFDFEGRYIHIQPFETIEYVMGDGRKAIVAFSEEPEGTSMCISFDAERSNELDLQQEGWQAILDNFKRYAETNVS